MDSKVMIKAEIRPMGLIVTMDVSMKSTYIVTAVTELMIILLVKRRFSIVMVTRVTKIGPAGPIWDDIVSITLFGLSSWPLSPWRLQPSPVGSSGSGSKSYFQSYFLHQHLLNPFLH